MASETFKIDLSKPDARAALRSKIESLPTGKYEFSIKPWNNKRTLGQNAYYWKKIVFAFSQFTGHDMDESHTFLKTKFLGMNKFIQYKNEKIAISTTTTLSVSEMAAYCEQCIAFLLQENMVQPDYFNEIDDN